MGSVRQLVDEAAEVFGKVPRPQHFTDHIHCRECAEHDAVLQRFAPDTIVREALGHPGWDPMTATTDAGFRYYLPGLICIVLTRRGDDDYIGQFVSLVVRDGPRNSHWLACTQPERAIVLKALHVLLEERTYEIDDWVDADRPLQAIEIWSDK